MNTWDGLILAHRGWSRRFPENTCLACERALELGADGLEFDVQLSADGVPVVMHDQTVERTTDGTGAVSALTVHELQALNAAYHWNGSVEGARFEPIPTLSDILAVANACERDVVVNIELKVYEQSAKELVKHVLEVVDESGLQNQYILYSSFEHESVQYLKQLRPEANIGLLFGEEVNNPLEYANGMGALSLNVPHAHLTKSMLEAARSRGFAVCAWTVDDVEEMKRLFENGIHLIITNTPDVAIKVRESMG